jgi:ribosome maturation factor RimP
MDDTLEPLVAEVRARVAAQGYELVDVQKRGAGSRMRLQVRIDRPDSSPGHGITIEECAAVSRVLEEWLDAEQALGPRYVLEVSSPGIERPLRWRDHWERFRGSDVNVRIRGRGRRRATIREVVAERNAVVLGFAEGATEEVPLEQVQDATLVVDWNAVERQARNERKTE